MKRLLYISAVGAMMLTACNKETDSMEQGAKGTPLAITVAVEGHTSDAVSGGQASAPQTYGITRTTDNGYKTTFAEGDALGIWVYEGATEKYANKQWVCQTDGSWEPSTPADNIYYNGTPMTIKAYFPFNPDATALPEAATFTVQADQSTLTNYRKSDLLLNGAKTWAGTASPLTLTFSHAMAMVEAVPSSIVNLQSVTLSASTKTGAAATTVTFFAFGNGTCRALLPEQTLNASLSLNYSFDSYTYPATKTLTGGEYYRYEVITAAAIGDYYYSDGTWSPTLHPSKTCVGIVFRAKTATQKGLVVSLDEATRTWGMFNTYVYTTDMDNGANNMATIQGIVDWAPLYPAFKWCSDKGTGWYLPALNELSSLFNVYNNDRTAFNTKLTASGGSNIADHWYLSSSEADIGGAWSIYFVSGSQYNQNKGNSYIVRAVRAF